MTDDPRLLPTDLHTPGPWDIKPVGSIDFRRPGEDDAKDVYIVGANGVCPGIVWDYAREGEANARLIAAAPDLLAALRLLAEETKLSGNWNAKDYGWPKAIAATMAAITKAEGRDYV